MGWQVTFWYFCGTSYISISLGWNIYVDVIYEKFYGTKTIAPRTMARGAPVYALSCIVLFQGIINTFVMVPLKLTDSKTKIGCGSFQIQMGLRKCYIFGMFFITFGGCVQGLAIRYTSIVALFVGSILFGCGCGLRFPLVRTIPLLFFVNVNLRGLGAAITGSGQGIWAVATFFNYLNLK